MKDIRAVRGTDYIRQLIAQGEHEHQDFKFAVSDARKIARTISAFANNGGGRLLIGVKDNGTVAGVRNDEDIYVVEQAASRYCRPEVAVEFKAYKVDGSLLVIVAEVPRSDVRPVVVLEADNSRKAYYRVADENIAAHPLMLEAWGRRGSTSFTDIHARVAEFVEKSGKNLEIKEIALGVHLSLATASAVVADLAACGIVDFCYDGHSFRIQPKIM